MNCCSDSQLTNKWKVGARSIPSGDPSTLSALSLLPTPQDPFYVDYCMYRSSTFSTTWTETHV